MLKVLFFALFLLAMLIPVELLVFLPWPVPKQEDHTGGKVAVVRLHEIDRVRNVLATPLMYLLSGTFSEAPQQTHYWNNRLLDEVEWRSINPRLCAPYEGGPTAGPKYRFGFPVFHMPIVPGWGWRRYVVVTSILPRDDWFVGVKWDGGAFISLIPVRGGVRILVGPGDACVFGFDAEGRQIFVGKVGEGTIGDGGPYRRLPLR